MVKVNKNREVNIKIIKHYIKDLSFENPQSINENNSKNNDNNNISQNISFIYEGFENNFFSVITKYSCECSSKRNGSKLFILELDYFGFFEIIGGKSHDQAELTKKGAQLIFPFVKSIIKDVTNKGGSLTISIQDLNFNLIKG